MVWSHLEDGGLQNRLYGGVDRSQEKARAPKTGWTSSNEIPRHEHHRERSWRNGRRQSRMASTCGLMNPSGCGMNQDTKKNVKHSALILLLEYILNISSTITCNSLEWPQFHNFSTECGSRKSWCINRLITAQHKDWKIKTFILPSATGRYTWRGTREHKAAHAPVDVHRSRTCRQRTEFVHHPRTAHWSCMTAAGQCRTASNHAACLQDSRQDSAEPVNINVQSANVIVPPTKGIQQWRPQTMTGTNSDHDGNNHDGHNHEDQLGEIHPIMLNEPDCTFGISFSRFHCCGHHGHGLWPSWFAAVTV